MADDAPAPSAGFDLVTVGRVGMDLYAQQVGADVTDVAGFDAMVGGSPANIAIGTARLGHRVAILTGVGDGEVGRFVRAGLEREGVDTSHVATVADRRTGVAILSVRPPDDFPLTFYRDDPADIHVTTDHADALPLDATRVLEVSGAALSRGAMAATTLRAAQRGAAVEGCTVLVDLDLRPDQWPDRPAFGVAMRGLFGFVDVVVGTEEEFHAALADTSPALTGATLDDDALAELDELVAGLHERRPGIVTVLKRGPRGVTVQVGDDPPVEVGGYTVEVANTVGAGDAFCSGLVHGHLSGWSWPRAARFGNACGAIEVTRHGCSLALPTLEEVEAFVAEHGGLDP